MDTLSLTGILKVVADFGIVGLVIYLWWADNRRIWQIMSQYKRDMDDQREMYKNNASLCRDFASIAQDLRSIVTLNIQTMTEVNDAVNQNQFCPLLRVEKQKHVKIINTDGD